MDVRDHGWFVFFAPHDNPEIAGVIFAEHAEHGYLGAPIAKYVDGDVFRQEGRPAAADAAAEGGGARTIVPARLPGDAVRAPVAPDAAAATAAD